MSNSAETAEVSLLEEGAGDLSLLEECIQRIKDEDDLEALSLLEPEVDDTKFEDDDAQWFLFREGATAAAQLSDCSFDLLRAR